MSLPLVRVCTHESTYKLPPEYLLSPAVAVFMIRRVFSHNNQMLYIQKYITKIIHFGICKKKVRYQ